MTKKQLDQAFYPRRLKTGVFKVIEKTGYASKYVVNDGRVIDAFPVRRYIGEEWPRLYAWWTALGWAIIKEDTRTFHRMSHGTLKLDENMQIQEAVVTNADNQKTRYRKVTEAEAQALTSRRGFTQKAEDQAEAEPEEGGPRDEPPPGTGGDGQPAVGSG